MLAVALRPVPVRTTVQFTPSEQSVPDTDRMLTGVVTVALATVTAMPEVASEVPIEAASTDAMDALEETLLSELDIDEADPADVVTAKGLSTVWSAAWSSRPSSRRARRLVTLKDVTVT